VRANPSKSGYYILEGLNSFATSFYFNYLLFLLRDDHGFGNLQNLLVGAVHGFIYIGGSWYGGRFGQRHGYFTSLRIGFGGMAASIALGGLIPALWGQLLALWLWTFTMCFTWPILEALVSEHESVERLPNRVGLYNVVWATTAAMGYSMGGWIFEHFGRASLYVVPVAIHAAQFLATWPLRARHDAWLAVAPPLASVKESHVSDSRPRYFQRLAWTANPFNYMAANTILAVVPGIAGHVGLSIPQAGLVMSVWYYVRAAAFLKLWWWPGWHYHFGWFLSAFALLLVGFVGVLVAPWVWMLIVAQIIFGWASALLYYSALYYAMDGSDSHGADGGIHEALIGIGICGGPAVSAAGQWLTGQAMAPAWTVTAFLAGGIALAWRIRRQELRKG
jgi:predicted MFS family arabinose efflux permease